MHLSRMQARNYLVREDADYPEWITKKPPEPWSRRLFDNFGRGNTHIGVQKLFYFAETLQFIQFEQGLLADLATTYSPTS